MIRSAMFPSRTRRWSRLALTCLALSLSLVTGAQAARPTPTPSGSDCDQAGAANRYAARAYSLHLDSTLAGIDADLGPVPDTGELPSSGGDRSATLATIDGVDPGIPLPGGVALHATVLHNTAMGSGNTSTAFSSVLGLDLALRAEDTQVLQVKATVLNAQSTVKCVNGNSQVDPDNTGSQIVNLAIDVMGRPVTVPASAPPNTQLALPEQLASVAQGSITLNEQTTVDGRQVVNALHVRLEVFLPEYGSLARIDLVVSHAEAGMSCGNGTDPDSCHCPVRDFVTGGGQVPVDGGRASFAVNGKAEDSVGPRGHLNVVNHVTRQHIRSSSLTGYGGSGNARTLTFTCSDNQYLSDDRCVVDIEDNGTSGGGTDRFGLNPGYPSSLLLHGNIVLHRPHCGASSGTGGGKGGGRRK